MTLFQRVFTSLGFGMLPMPAWGLHWVLYGTFMACVVTSLRRLSALRREGAAPAAPDAGRERVTSGALMFTGIFGAGALTMYVGRSHPAVLIGMFPAWALALVLLSWLTLRGFGSAARRARPVMGWVIPTALAVAAYALCVGEALPHPHPRYDMSEGSDLGAQNVAGVTDAARLGALVRESATPGEKVVISWPAGHLIAERAGVDDVFPFAHVDSIILERQVEAVFDRIRAERVSKYFGSAPPELVERIRQSGLGVTFYFGP
jgi:hypothetical protein